VKIYHFAVLIKLTHSNIRYEWIIAYLDRIDKAKHHSMKMFYFTDPKII